ncbi:uncharacterized protein EI97DRAFT_437100 [Westerdykella ornata]|uniref:Uncharacterized protein n=1 Tax=Westerdykella ornata TaxID=318751 RepID=A0A6A6J877_WESOR|nr:uncharacterized protein EI97DRAFT_437100 [Westerdykella ornata]KAF2272208.1 hypothetical protein EI97DRAFT_437100 [Westerdykella ornata]
MSWVCAAVITGLDDFQLNNLELPARILSQFDILETVQPFVDASRWLGLSHLVPLALLKWHILRDLSMLANARLNRAAAGIEGADAGLARVNVSSATAAREDIMNASYQDLESFFKTVKGQLSELFHAVVREDPNFWPAIWDGEIYLSLDGQDLARHLRPASVQAVKYNWQS